jgi:hypothetical protein
MFLKIDNVLIAGAQWSVRQIELCTKATRSNIFSFFVRTAWWLTWMNVIYCFLVSPLYPLQPLVGLAILYYSQRIIRRYRVLFASENPVGCMPSFIITRREIRSGEWILMVLSAGISMITYGVRDVLLAIPCGMYSIFILNTLIFNYLLCTTSLPPGEKERKKQEREMEKMTAALN